MSFLKSINNTLDVKQEIIVVSDESDDEAQSKSIRTNDRKPVTAVRRKFKQGSNSLSKNYCRFLTLLVFLAAIH